MKAVVWTKYGSADGLELREVAKPAPKDNEISIRVHAATVTAGDCEIRSLNVPMNLGIPMRLFVGLTRPKRMTVLGQEFAGEVASVGSSVRLFKKGDRVFGTTGFTLGAHAEYLCLPEESEDGVLTTMPSNMTFEEAAAVPTGGLEALHFLDVAEIKPDHKVLICGAGGSIGTAGIQIAKDRGAVVTAVDSEEKLEMLRSIGADHIIDYRREDFTRNGETYDAIFDVVGKAPFPRCMSSITEGGVYLLANPSIWKIIRGRRINKRGRWRVVTAMTDQKTEDLVRLRDLIEAGKLRTVIDRRYPLADTADAHRYVESGGKKGNVVIVVRPEDAS